MILAYPAAKIVIGLLTVNLVSGAVTSAFGTAWERLPSDVRDDLENRVQSAYGDALADLSDDAAAQQIETDLEQGLMRLDDDTLIRRLRLVGTALQQADATDCAAFGRAALAGQVASDTTQEHIAGALDTTDFQAWAEIAVEAIEAELRGSPATRTVAVEQGQQASDAIFAKFSPAQLELLLEVVENSSATDADVCSTIRAIYDVLLTLDPANLATLALIDVTP